MLSARPRRCPSVVRIISRNNHP